MHIRWSSASAPATDAAVIEAAGSRFDSSSSPSQAVPAAAVAPISPLYSPIVAPAPRFTSRSDRCLTKTILRWQNEMIKQCGIHTEDNQSCPFGAWSRFLEGAHQPSDVWKVILTGQC